MRNVKIGAPGYILLKNMAADMPGTLKKVAEMGYDGIEITGFFGKQAGEIRDMCRDAGLEPFGCYAMLPNLLGEKEAAVAGNWGDFMKAFAIPADSADEAMEYICEIGCTYVGLLSPNEPPTEESFQRWAKASEIARKHGLKLQYHNHDYEYNNVVNGECRMDTILKNTPKELLFEPDLGWLAIAGSDPVQVLRQYADRIESVHLKDYFRAGPDPRDSTREYRFRPTGYGVMDWSNIVPVCEELIKPVWYVADHDSAYEGDAFDELAMSLDYIKNLLRFC